MNITKRLQLDCISVKRISLSRHCLVFAYFAQLYYFSVGMGKKKKAPNEDLAVCDICATALEIQELTDRVYIMRCPNCGKVYERFNASREADSKRST